jgi:hypothetical protein
MGTAEAPAMSRVRGGKASAGTPADEEDDSASVASSKAGASRGKPKKEEEEEEEEAPSRANRSRRQVSFSCAARVFFSVFCWGAFLRLDFSLPFFILCLPASPGIFIVISQSESTLWLHPTHPLTTNSLPRPLSVFAERGSAEGSQETAR